RVVGPLEFSMVGVIASLTGTLATADISVFVVSTFDADLVLVKEADLDATIAALKAVGHDVSS
ncbi:ACT domain-containing protein, partial [Planctomycetaceae bacterium]|nr:ACT domain-containing protein [Planctomycetaceae bacterium]